MYNFQNVNDHEFEMICKDMLEVHTGKNFRTYAKGRDGGIDIKAVVNEKVIGQAKHYSSTVANLMSSLRKEISKVRVLEPDEYYLFTSMNLSSNNVDEIFAMFKDYMPSKEYIFDSVKINNCLDKEDYSEVVRKHFKLWMVSTNVLEIVINQDVYIDSEYLFDDIEKESEFYVETSAYHSALNILDKHSVVLLEGDPGVGKTTISKMLVLYYISKGYKVRYVTDNSIGNLKKGLSANRTQKEIVLLDDFLGQHYMNIKDEKPNEVKSLINHIKKNPSKKLILNSRITILQEAMRKYSPFRILLENQEVMLYRIMINEMSNLDKALIFYNHLYFTKIPVEYFEQLVEDERYLYIIKHKNYNPRIIEFVTREKVYKGVELKKYFEYIVKKLENPSDIWYEEFYERISKVDRIFMFTLYSLTNTSIPLYILRNAFNFRIKYESDIDITIDVFNQCLIRLTNSMVTLLVDEKKDTEYIRVINPSVNDFIKSTLDDNEPAVYEIARRVFYYEQYQRMREFFTINNKIKIDDTTELSNFLEQNSFSNSMEYYFLEELLEDKIESNLKSSIIQRLLISRKTYRAINGKSNSLVYQVNLGCYLIIKYLTSIGAVQKYSLGELLFSEEHIIEIIDLLDYDSMCTLVDFYKKLSKNQSFERNFSNEFVNMLEKLINDLFEDEIENKVFELIDEKLGEVVSDTVNDAYSDMKYDYYNGISDLLSDEVKNVVLTEIEELIDEKHDDLGCGFISINTKANASSILNDLDIDKEITLNLSSDEDYDDDYDHYRSSSVDVNDYEIHRLFQRD